MNNRINKLSSLLLSISLHMLIGTIIYIEYKFYKPEETFKPSHVKMIKVNLKTEYNNQIILNKNSKQKFSNKEIHKNEEQNTSIVSTEKTKILDYPNEAIKYSYGEDFFKLSDEEQKYIAKAWSKNNDINEIMSRIIVKDKIYKEHNPNKLDLNDSNTVIFYLMPDGSAQDIHFDKNRTNSYFDELVANTIYQSTKFYEKPKQKTLIKIKIGLEKAF